MRPAPVIAPDPAPAPPRVRPDYSLTGVGAAQAVAQGLAEADWYQTPVPRATMRRLLERHDGPALRDTLIWFALIFGAGWAGYALWGTGWAILPFAFYGVLYASSSDSRWHEAGHGTAFRSDWMNRALYEIASFMVMRESVVWHWSHTRHHSDTIIVGRDPEIAVPRPANLRGIAKAFFALGVYPAYFRRIVAHSFGRMSAHEKVFIPASEYPRVFLRARIYVAIYASSLALAIASRSVLPLLYIGLANLYGSWLMPIYGLTQHAGMAENVLDHRLNTRTVYMNRVNRFLYWNMNYHVEHHMFPLVPYHALPRLHEAVKDDMPTPYPGIWAAFREIVPTIFRQVKDPAHHVKRRLPPPRGGRTAPVPRSLARPDGEGWVDAGAAADLGRDEAMRCDQGKATYVLCRDAAGQLFALDGVCTHGNAHLADGLVKGGIIECPKHNGRFHLADGSPARSPVCRGLAIYALREQAGRLQLNPARAGGAGYRPPQTCRFRVVSNRSVATFIKELVIEPLDSSAAIAFRPGEYLQFDIPAYERIAFRDFDIPEPYAAVWERQHLFELVARHAGVGRRNNYSIASNGATESRLRFNVRIAMPPPGQDCPPGVGSAYVFSLRPGAVLTAIGAFGDFHIKPTQKEMVYVGGGAGMAPLRAHLSHLFEIERCGRRVSFWYGARSRQEMFYDDYFRALAAGHPNFSFHPALSSPLETDGWDGLTGFIHEVVLEHHLLRHPHPDSVEYYLCGPPMMVAACLKMLGSLGVPDGQISHDEF